MTPALRVFCSPRQAVATAAGGGRTPALGVVTASGLIAAAVSVLSSSIAGSAVGPGTLVTVMLIPPLFALLWLLGVRLIDVGARLMERKSQRATLLCASSVASPILVVATCVGLVQSALVRGGASPDTVALVGVLALLVLCWYIAIVGMAVSHVYDVSTAPALALALLPFAALAAAVMVYVLVISALHGLGLV